VQTVYLRADGSLSVIAWAAISGRNKGRILLDDFTLAVVPNGPYLLEEIDAKSTSSTDQGSLLIVGDVAYDDEPREATPASRGFACQPSVLDDRPIGWVRLNGTAREADLLISMARNLGTVRLTGPDASTVRVLDELPRARWAHLATHGFFAEKRFRSAMQLDGTYFEDRFARSRERQTVAERNPLALSGLILAGANRLRTNDEFGIPQGDGGMLTAEAIASLDLSKLELAVLSACDTGLGDVASDEGVMGLTRAFHMAGTRNVIASLWKVDDQATCALMKVFYTRLWKENKPPIEALREAQLYIYRNPDRIAELAGAEPGKLEQLIANRGFDLVDARPKPKEAPSASPKTAPPRLWAGFVLSGFGR
jgi:CHAT domain-containing protein